MDILHAVIFSAVQGLTEFLPISSSAHIHIASDLFGYEVHSVGFDIAIHFATLIATLLYFRADIKKFVFGYVSGDYAVRSFVHALVIATLPIVLLGFVAYRNFDVLQSEIVIAFALIFSGAVLFVLDRYVQSRYFVPVFSDLSMCRRGFIIGLFQALAIIPGISRSGITIAGGRLMGFSRTEAVRFSFLLAIPTITGALILLISDISSDGVLRTVFDSDFSLVLPIAFSMVVSFLVAYSVIHLFIALVERIGFGWFFMYQIFLGVVILIM